MAEFDVKLADLTFHIKSVYNTPQMICKDYLIEERGEHEIVLTQENIDLERLKVSSDSPGVDPGLRVAPDPHLETIALLRKLANCCSLHNRILMHGSSIAVDGNGYIFTAVSGTGKSTHTALLRDLLGDRAVMVNDDKPFLYVTDDQIYVCGSPWMGKHGLGNNMMVPLKGIFFLKRSEENVLSPMAPYDALPLLIAQCHRPEDQLMMLNTLDMMDKILSKVSLYDFGCNMDPSAAVLSSSVMK